MQQEGEELSFHFVGDAFVDLFCYLEDDLPETGGDALLLRPVNQLAGGSAVNTTTHFAALLKDFLNHKLLPDVKLHTVVNPQDDYGRVMIRHAEEQLSCPLVNCRKEDSTASTGHCVVIVARGERSFMTHAGCIGEFEARDLDLDLLVGGSSNSPRVHHSHIHIAGYYNIPGFWNGRLKEKLVWIREKRKDLPYETSTTISLVPQHDARGEWDGKIVDLMPLVDFAIMNDLEANYISGRKAETKNDVNCVEEWATFFAIASAKTWIVVTRGEHGAVALREGRVLAKQPAVKVNVVDPTGSGDCFSAAFLYGVWKWKQTSGFDPVRNNWPLEAVKQGLVWGCGAATCGTLTRGASVPSRKEDIEKLVQQTAIITDQG